MVTIKEIAQSLNVSTATVSNVIHGRLHKMSPQTAQMVRAKLEEYGYVPNMGARMLARGDSQLISVITNYLDREDRPALQDPFVNELVAALENEIRRQNHYMMLYAAQTASEINTIAQTWNTLGLIVVGLNAEQSRELIRVAQRPVVFIDCYFDSDEAYHNIGLEDRRGGYLMTRHLIEHGHRHIAFVRDDMASYGVDVQRLMGYKDALTEAGLPFTEDRFITISRSARLRARNHAALIQRIGRPETAFMFCSDYYAVETMHALQNHGVRIPQDVSITGFDDNLLARFSLPSLATVHQTVAHKAEHAVELLLRIIDNPQMPPQSIVLPVHLVKGESVGPPAQAE